MPQKNQLTNEDQDQRRIVEAQMFESRSGENQYVDTAVSEGGSEASVTFVPSSLTPAKEAGEYSAQTTDIQAPQVEGKPTGPRTEVGKKKSSQNAIKFGIFSGATLLKGESRAEYTSLWEGLWNALSPEGKLEELLVEKLMSISWRYRRMLVAEGAEIRKNSEFLEFDRRQVEQEQAEAISQGQQPRSLVDFTLEPVGLIWKIHNPDVLRRCMELLVDLRESIKTNGLDEDRDRSILQTIYGDASWLHLQQTFYLWYLSWCRTAKVSEGERQSEGYAPPEVCKQNVLRRIAFEIWRLKHYQETYKLIESERRKVEILRQRVPDSPGLDRLLRYESSLDRAFDRTLTQLERLQRMRKGQPVLPPVKVDVSL